MKYLLCFAFLFPTLCFAGRSISVLKDTAEIKNSTVSIKGYVIIEDGSYTFIDTSSNQFKLRAVTDSAKQALLKLQNLDAISGTATQYDDRTLLLESIDFVGLRRLIGRWTGDSQLVDFQDYTRVRIFSSQSSNHFRYAISPSSGDSWRVFFSTENSVTLGSLLIQGQTAQIDLYDATTGDVSHTIQLQKVKNP
ncbi:MAG: hypothetical protein COT73_03410 [Bdellovibrio sp. CG10_big_fil_rev_8_21_14_0_10_47_8]|nr:MAG: hypothetical protein COT73_03410 [Bdellovibrio sp. CG10_big_fil_rev_8_21_14_0_10_47_8]